MKCVKCPIKAREVNDRIVYGEDSSSGVYAQIKVDVDIDFNTITQHFRRSLNASNVSAEKKSMIYLHTYTGNFASHVRIETSNLEKTRKDKQVIEFIRSTAVEFVDIIDRGRAAKLRK